MGRKTFLQMDKLEVVNHENERLEGKECQCQEPYSSFKVMKKGLYRIHYFRVII